MDRYRTVIDERIHDLWVYRNWYLKHPWTLDWPTRQEDLLELRALVKLARKARKVERVTIAPKPTHDPECDCHHLNRYPADYWAGDHFVGMS